MDNLFAQPFYIWIFIAVVAFLLELVLPSFTFTFVGLGALVAAATTGWLSGLAQVIVFSVSLFVSAILLRPVFVKKLHPRGKMHSRSDRHVGAHGQVTETIDAAKGSGRITVAGEDWAASADCVIDAGQKILVTDSDGITLIVSPK